MVIANRISASFRASDKPSSSSRGPLAYYWDSIGKHRTLTRQEEIDLARRIRANDRAAFNELILCNLKFVVSVCRNYENKGLPLSDLINEGNIGLIRAAVRFDETKEFKFISYAVWWIRQSILLALNEQVRMVKLPYYQIKLKQKISKASTHLEQRLGRAPNQQEMSDHLGVEVRAIQDSMALASSQSFNESPRAGFEGVDRMESLTRDDDESPEDAFSQLELREGIRNALQCLTDREAAILKMRYGIDFESRHSLEEIGTRFNLTRERVRQIIERALRRLRHAQRTAPLLACI